MGQTMWNFSDKRGLGMSEETKQQHIDLFMMDIDAYLSLDSGTRKIVERIASRLYDSGYYEGEVKGIASCAKNTREELDKVHKQLNQG